VGRGSGGGDAGGGGSKVAVGGDQSAATVVAAATDDAIQGALVAVVNMPPKQIARLAKCTGTCAAGPQRAAASTTPPPPPPTPTPADQLLSVCNTFLGAPADACKSLSDVPAALASVQARAVSLCGSGRVAAELPEELTPAQCATRLQAAAWGLAVQEGGQMRYDFAVTAALLKHVLGLA
jgi:hypothetical protein